MNEVPSFNHVMIDFETLGVHAANVAFLEVGVAYFSRSVWDKQGLEGDVPTGIDMSQCYVVTDVDKQIGYGAQINHNTLLWHLTRGADTMASRERTKELDHHCTTEQSLRILNRQLADPGLRIWSNGAGFDIAILRWHMQRHDIQPSWDFRNERCYRTVYRKLKTAYPPAEDAVMAHRGEADAVMQAEWLLRLPAHEWDV